MKMKTWLKEEIDPVEEVRRVREANAAKFNYNLRAIIEDARSRQGKDGSTVVDLHAEAMAKIARGDGRVGR